MELSKRSHVAGGDTEWCSENQCGSFFKSQTCTCHRTQRPHSWTPDREKWKRASTQNLGANGHGYGSSAQGGPSRGHGNVLRIDGRTNCGGPTRDGILLSSEKKKDIEQSKWLGNIAMSTRSPSEKVPYSTVSFTGQSMHDKVIAVRTGPGQGADDCKGVAPGSLWGRRNYPSPRRGTVTWHHTCVKGRRRARPLQEKQNALRDNF